MGKKHWVITEFVQFFDMSTPYQIVQQAKTDKAKKQIAEKQSEILEMAADNWTVKDIAAKTGIDRSRLYPWLKKNNVSTPYQIVQQAKTDKVKKQIAEKQSEILEMAADNWTVTDIAAKTGIDRRRLYPWLKKNNVKFKKNKYNGRKVIKPTKAKAEPIRKPIMTSAVAMALGVKI